MKTFTTTLAALLALSTSALAAPACGTKGASTSVAPVALKAFPAAMVVTPAKPPSVGGDALVRPLLQPQFTLRLAQAPIVGCGASGRGNLPAPSADQLSKLPAKARNRLPPTGSTGSPGAAPTP